MRRFLGGLLIVCALLSVFPVKVYAQNSYNVEAGGIMLSPSLLPYSDGSQIMVPFRATTEALGGIWIDVPTGTAHKAAILNDMTFYIITGINCQIVMPPMENIDFSDAEGLDGYMDVFISLVLDGTIPLESIDYPIVERSGDIFIPLEVFASAFDLNVSLSDTAIHFESGFVFYRRIDSNVTFSVRYKQ